MAVQGRVIGVEDDEAIEDRRDGLPLLFLTEPGDGQLAVPFLPPVAIEVERILIRRSARSLSFQLTSVCILRKPPRDVRRIPLPSSQGLANRPSMPLIASSGAMSRLS